jgi:ribosomal protein L13E
LLAGLTLVALVVGCATGARLLGIAVDGVAHESVFKLVPELVLVCLSLVGIAVERRRRQIEERRSTTAARQNWQTNQMVHNDREMRVVA